MLSDSLAFRRAMGVLIEFSMIEINQQSSSYAIHPVVQQWCLHIAEAQHDTLRNKWRELALIAVGYLVPSKSERDYWQLQQRLLPHADYIQRISKKTCQ